MNTYIASKDDLYNALRRYTDLLNTRKETLEELSSVSDELLQSLQLDQEIDLNAILEKRKNQCLKLGEVVKREVDESPSLELARQAAKLANEEIRSLAQNVIALHGDSKILAENVLLRQNECEAILKDRLQSIAKAIRESKQRGQLGAAYGPACSHLTPKFLDTRK